MPGFASGISAAFRTKPIYLAAFCISYPFALFELNIDYYGWLSLLPAILLLPALAVPIFWVFERHIRDSRLSGLAALTALMLLFPSSTRLLPAFTILTLTGIALVVVSLLQRTNRTSAAPTQLPTNFTVIANVVAGATCVAAVLGPAQSQFLADRQADHIAATRLDALRPGTLAPPSGALPHIVHIVLDGYSRADVLQNTYGFDNTPFLTALRARGFRVATEATTPFNQTLFVMGSIFSLGHIVDRDSFRTPAGDTPAYRNKLASVLRTGVLIQLLSRLGYDIQATPAEYAPLQPAGVVGSDGRRSAFGHLGFRSAYIFAYDMLNQSAALEPVTRYFLGPWLDVVEVNYSYLAQIPIRRFEPATGRPLFVYQHVLAPHPPFNITPEGRRRPLAGFPFALSDASAIIRDNDRRRELYRLGYIDKLRYINGAILQQIDEIKAQLRGPLIVILHGDHGGGMHHDLDSKASTCVAERFSPLLAVYATDPEVLAQIRDEFSLVNLYRAVFRTLLGADLPDLPEQSVFIPWELDGAMPVSDQERGIACPPPTMTERVASPGR
ncbi:hypothetical protein [Desertibaculum subflavum]|uniref:hypothetical protein n=1 Tax=Desertibaculum subflavum TaxID=2268458 RepID=UPI000E6621C3